MGAADIRLRMATQDDAQTVASIITTVSEGVIEYLLGDLFPGMTPEKICYAPFGRSARQPSLFLSRIRMW